MTGVQTCALPICPLFHATASSATSLSTSTYVKIGFDTKTFDTANCFSTSNNRFTPNVPGYYQISAAVQYNGTSTTTGFVFFNIYKNGSGILVGNLITAIQYAIPAASGLVYCNGTTDYIEIYAYQSQGSTQTITGMWFQGSLIRSV